MSQRGHPRLVSAFLTCISSPPHLSEACSFCILFVLPSPFTSISRCVQNILYQRRMCRNYCDTPFSFPEAANPSRVCLHLSLIYPHASVTGFSNLLLNWHYSGKVFISVFTVLEVGTILQCSPFFLFRCFPPFWNFILLVPLMFQNLSPLPVLQGQVSCFSHYVSLLHPRNLE